MAQTVTLLVNPGPSDGVIYGFLLTDGSVMYQGGNVSDWYRFFPDQYGSYQNGTWTQAASTPQGYGPYATGGGVLPDGRLLLAGGEYTVDPTGSFLVFDLTNQSAIYDPVANTWTMVNPPRGWASIGDSPGTVQANGKFLLGQKLTTYAAQFEPDTLTWTRIATPGKSDINAEEGWTLLPDGSIFTTDVSNAPNSERFFPSVSSVLSHWSSLGSTPVNLKFTWSGVAGEPLKWAPQHWYKPAGEIGPNMLRPDGTVFATGAINTGAIAGHTAVWAPGASSSDPGTWTTGPDFAAGDDAGDQYAVLLPSGDVLVEANTDGHDAVNRPDKLTEATKRLSAIRSHQVGIQPHVGPTAAATPLYHLYQFDGTNLNLEPVDITGGSLALLVLPTGETIVGGVGLYTPASGNPAPDWAPVITSFPSTATHGTTYQIFGQQFNGLSQAAAFGDEFPNPTNYPLVRITNSATGHVFYARTHDHSTMAVATGDKIVSTFFDVPATIETGASILQVVANGIPSRAVSLTID